MADRRWRVWDDDEKRRIVAQTQFPGVSVSQVARRYDLNANLVFKWLRDPRFKGLGMLDAAEEACPFLPVEVIGEPPLPNPAVAASQAKIEITLSKSGARTGSSPAQKAAANQPPSPIC